MIPFLRTVQIYENLEFENSGKYLDMAKNELRNAVIQNVATLPASPSLGQIVSHSNKLKYYNGTAWITLEASSYYLSRGNHTGTQLADTISNFTEAAQDAVGSSLTDTNSIDFAYLDSSNQITANLQVVSTGGLEITSSGVQLKNSGVTAGTYTKVTVDAKGRVTLGAGIAEGDLPSHNHFHTDISDFDAGVRDNPLHTMAPPTDHLYMNSRRITSLADPVNDTDAANKRYVDNAITGFAWKEPVDCATTGTISLSGEQIIDGVSATAGDRVLVKNQSLAYQNGIYVVQVGSWSRATDADSWSEHVSASVWVSGGDTNANTGWVCTVDDSGTLNSDPINWTQFTGGSAIVDGDGLGKTGNEMFVKVDDDTIQILADTLEVKMDTNGGLTSTTSGVKLNVSSEFTVTSNQLQLASTYSHKKVVAQIAADTGTEQEIVHNLGSEDVLVFAYQSTGTYKWQVYPEVRIGDANSIYVNTNGYSEQVEIVIMG